MSNKIRSEMDELRRRLQIVNDLNGAGAVLYWDQATYMPSGGTAARGRRMATLTRLAHERFTDPGVGKLLDALQPYAESLPADSDDAALWRVTRRQYDRATRVPADFMAEITAHASESYDVWTHARPANDFAAVRPFLEKTVALSRGYADFFPEIDHPADAHIAEADYGMTVAQIRPLFAELQDALTAMTDVISRREPVDDAMLRQAYPIDAQQAFGEKVIRAYGYDFKRGRQDLSPHPFSIALAIDDVRITTRFKERDFNEGLFSTLHESGHAMYEQGIDPALAGTPLADGTSAGVHESQSRLWENMVGRSRGFWRYYYPRLQAAFPDQLGRVEEEAFYRAINKVMRSLIRTDADEVTYNLHVIIRFGLAMDVLEGTVSVADLPAVWHARYEEALGVRAPDDRDGVLQDVHWYGGLMGGSFQGYTLGNIMGAQFFAAAVAQQPAIPEEIARGEFGPLHEWLRANIYRHGSKFTADELLERATGGPLQLGPYLEYLRKKFGEIYGEL
ncbi:MAG: carboxypeptidase M32 [Caldilineaceae bacterium]|nr:carboxypeptidase M32 [Caldilineaceae bacterium]